MSAVIDKFFFNGLEIVSKHLKMSKEELEKELFNKYKAKSIDFLICSSILADETYNDEHWYHYTPVVAIEIDGESHSKAVYGQQILEQQKYNDQIKDSIFQALNIPLIRHTLANNTINKNKWDSENDYKKLKEKIKPFLSN